jgi:hypothetical protein
MLGRADTEEAIGLNRSRLRSTRPFFLISSYNHHQMLMTIKLTSILSMMTMLCFALCMQAQEGKKLTNEKVLQMIKAEVPESTVMLAIEADPSELDTSADALIKMNQGGASKSVLDAMVAAKNRKTERGQPIAWVIPGAPLVLGPVAPDPGWQCRARACSCASIDWRPLSYPRAPSRQLPLSRVSSLAAAAPQPFLRLEATPALNCVKRGLCLEYQCQTSPLVTSPSMSRS